MAKVEVKINDWLTEGFNLYKANFGVLVLASLIAVLLSGVTLGILAGPMMAGMYFICFTLYDKKGPSPAAGDVFKGFGYFLQSFLFILVWGLLMMVAALILNIIPILGQLAYLALAIVVGAFLMFGLPLIVDKEMAFWPASMESFNLVKTNFWPFLGFSLIASIIGYAGSIICGIGLIFTLPIWACMLTVAYRDVFGEGRASDAGGTSSEAGPHFTPTKPPEPEDTGGES